VSSQEIGHREDSLGDVIGAKGRHGNPDLWSALADTADRDVISRALHYLAKLLWNPDKGGEATIDDEDVLAISEKLAIDLAAAWKKDAVGPLTERWLNLRNKEALRELAEKAKILTANGETKGEIVRVLLGQVKKLPPPAELLKPKKPKKPN